MHNPRPAPAHCVAFVANSENRTVGKVKAPPQWSSIDTESKQKNKMPDTLARKQWGKKKQQNREMFEGEDMTGKVNIRAE